MKNKLLIVLSLLIISVGAQAKLAGKNVVSIKDFNNAYQLIKLK